MPKDSENTHSEATPHFDGKYDRVIKDSFGTQMGIWIERKNENHYDVTKLNNQDMKKFEKLTRGTDVENAQENRKKP